MLATRWNVLARPWWGGLNQLHSEVNRLFDHFGERWPAPAEEAVFPPINMWEDDDGFQLEAELPGFSMDELEIYVTGADQLSIKGERKSTLAPAKGVQHRQERFQGTFTRAFTLPTPVDPNKVEARLENGVLVVHLAKEEKARPRKIEVKG